MRKILLLTSLTISTFHIYADTLKIKKNGISLGVGLGWALNNPGYDRPEQYTLSPSLFIERKPSDFLAFGAQFGIHHRSKILYTIGSSGNVNQSSIDVVDVFFVPQYALYFSDLFFLKNIDLYMRAGLGFIYVSPHFFKAVPEFEKDDGFMFIGNINIGGRYYFRPNAALFAEFGYGLSYINVGLTVRY